jgi:biotin transport system substrate-specific component
MKINNKRPGRLSVRDMALIAIFTAMMTVCSWISVPLTVPMTLQTFAVFLTAGLLGRRRGVLTVVLYILLGTFGLPVFAGFKGGPGALLGTTGGYITGFVFTALIVGLTVDRRGRSVPVLAASMALGLLVCYAFGTAWFM